jgi:hypothetical protein
MASEQNLTCISLAAAADLSSKQYYAVTVNSSGTAELCDAAGESVTGILQNDPTSGQIATVAVGGISKGILGGTVAAGAMVKTNSSGKFITAAAATTTVTGNAETANLTGSYVLGIAITGGVSNDIVQILITHMGAIPTTAA